MDTEEPKGKRTVLMKPSDEPDDEIPAITYKNISEMRMKNQKTIEHQEKKIVKLFIKDILKAEKVCTSKMFKIFDFTFRTVYVRGTVVAANLHKINKFIITVDDATEQIGCFLEKNVDVEEGKIEMRQNYDYLCEILKDNKQNSVLRTAALIQRFAKNKFDRTPLYNGLHIGDTVELIGNLSEYEHKKYIFVDYLFKEDSYTFLDDLKYYKNLLYLYEHVYKESLS